MRCREQEKASGMLKANWRKLYCSFTLGTGLKAKFTRMTKSQITKKIRFYLICAIKRFLALAGGLMCVCERERGKERGSACARDCVVLRQERERETVSQRGADGIASIHMSYVYHCMCVCMSICAHKHTD